MRRVCFFFLLCSFLLSCSYRELSTISLDGNSLYALSREAAGGRVSLSDFGVLEYVPRSPLQVYGEKSLEVRYRFGFEDGEDAGALESLEEDCSLVLTLVPGTGEGSSWVLPLSAAFLGISGRSFSRFCYALPVRAGELAKITLTLTTNDNAKGTDGIFFELESFGLAPLRYGFSLSDGSLDATPFVWAEGESLVIDVPGPYQSGGGYELAAGGLSGDGEFFAASERYAYLGLAGGGDILSLPPGMLPADPFPLGFRGRASSFVYRAEKKSPHEPVVLDPGLIDGYPRENWRNRDYEVFRWDRFPEILIFDTADYAVQDRLFKRLAFFVEKAGFRGRLAPDSEIETLHAWNAHDYRAGDLARFFELARQSGFPLNNDEEALEALLLAEGILRGEGGAILPGTGAVISVSRESAAYLRTTFMVHEIFHGLFFIDEEFRDFSRRRWANFDPAGKRFLVSYFEYSGYDSADQYLMVNEFMAYCLQQGASQAGEYFGTTLASRIAAHPWRRNSLPPGGPETWPSLAALFSAEAEAFSRFVRNRFDLSAGRVRRVYKE